MIPVGRPHRGELGNLAEPYAEVPLEEVAGARLEEAEGELAIAGDKPRIGGEWTAA